MSSESAKAIHRRKQIQFFAKFCQGQGIDIGCGNDPVLPEVAGWDLVNGDAQYMAGVPDSTYDFVYSSHCLEHLRDPYVAIKNWWRILKPGGFLIVQVPDEDLYEQGVFPSRFNSDHKFSFTISKSKSWSKKSINVTSLFKGLKNHKVVYLNLCDTNYDYSSPSNVDQTADRRKGVEVSIEFVVQKLVNTNVVSKLKLDEGPPEPEALIIPSNALTSPPQSRFGKDEKGNPWLMIRVKSDRVSISGF